MVKRKKGMVVRGKEGGSAHLPLRRPVAARGLTLIESIVAMAVLSLFGSLAYLTMLRLNQWATVSRLQTLAGALAMERVDEALSRPWPYADSPYPVTSGTESDLFLNAETGIIGAGTQRTLRVPATRITLVTPLDTEPSPSKRLISVSGSVVYSFRGRTYSAPFSTQRTCDNY